MVAMVAMVAMAALAMCCAERELSGAHFISVHLSISRLKRHAVDAQISCSDDAGCWCPGKNV